MATDIQILPLEKGAAQEAAMAQLLTANRRSFEARFPILNNLTQAETTEAEKFLMGLCSDEDRFGYYHVAVFGENASGTNKSFNLAQCQTSFLANPSRTEWSHCVFSETSMGFARHVVNERRVERSATDENGVERLISQIEPRDIFLFCEAEIIPHGQQRLLVLKFPWYRRKLSQPYYFGEEINYISNWVSQHLQVKLNPFPLKLFFEAFRPHSYFDKSDFYLKELKSAGGNYPMDMKVGSDLNGLTNAYANLDKVLSTTMSASMAEKFSEQVRKSNLPEQDKVIEFAKGFFETQGISSQEFFEVLHQTFEYGLGRITYSRGKEFLHYKLDYTEDVPGLIRASKLGWDDFEHLWGEIKNYIN